MATSDERREVAQELRALDMSDIEVDGCIIDSPKYVGLLLMRMLDVACDYRGGLHYFPGFFSAQAVVELFADLIDPTCHLDLTDVETYGNAKVRTYECSECGRSCEEIYGEYERCPHCGARVVSGDE